MKKFATLVVAGTMVFAACSSGGEDSGGDVNDVVKTCAPTDGALALIAKDIKFDKDCLAVKAETAFTIELQNGDSDQHNVSIFTSKGGSSLFKGTEFADGGKTVTYEVGALDAGSYYFHCDIHPEMNGTFVVAA